MRVTRRVILGAAAAIVGGALLGATANAAEKKAAIVLPGGITDQAFNQVLYEGIILVRDELKIEVAHSEKVKQADQSEHLEDYARRGYGLVFGAGGEFVESTKRAAQRYPDTMFACLNCALIEGVATVNYDNQSIGYLLGYVAGKVSTTGKIGLISGQKIKPALDIIEGMEKGLKAARGSGEVLVTYTNDWDDVAKAKEAAFAQISQGAEAIVPYLDNGIVGVMQGLKEKGKWGLGAITDLNASWPDTNLVSVVQNWRQAVLTFTKLYLDGKAERKNYVFGIGTPPLSLGTVNAKVPAAVKGDVDKLVADMKAGKLPM